LPSPSKIKGTSVRMIAVSTIPVIGFPSARKVFRLVRLSLVGVPRVREIQTLALASRIEILSQKCKALSP
jgi:hypothetical protein